MANKLLLLEDIDGLGRSGDIVKVKPGYARNFLLPKGLAYIADKRALRMQARLQEERRKRAVVDQKESEEQAKVLDALSLTAVVKVDQEGHMYGSVSAVDIASLIQEASTIEIKKSAVILKHPIRELGDYKIALKLKEGVKATVSLKVEAEEGAVIIKPAPTE